MQDDISDIREFYDLGVPLEDGRLQRHQLERDRLLALKQSLDLLFHISTEASMVASSRHLLYIGRKLS